MTWLRSCIDSTVLTLKSPKIQICNLELRQKVFSLNVPGSVIGRLGASGDTLH